jgi:DUF4097 and DUF4098 domain-containing protein YvlB
MQDDLYEQEKPKRGLEDDAYYGTPMEADYQGPRRRRRWPLWIVLGCMGLCFLCCIAPICAVAMGGAALASVMKTASVTTSQTFAVPEGEPVTLFVDNPVGDITIRQGASDEVEVTYTKKAYGLSQSSADRNLNDLQLSITQPQDDTIRIVAENANDLEQLSELLSIGNQIQLTITVPERVLLDISTNVSDITVEDVQAESLRLETNTGEIRFDGSLTGASGQRANRIATNVGSITVRLPQDAAVALSARSDVGNVSVSDRFDRYNPTDTSGSGPSEQWTGTLGQDGDRPALDLQTNTGDIKVEVR